MVRARQRQQVEIEELRERIDGQDRLFNAMVDDLYPNMRDIAELDAFVTWVSESLNLPDLARSFRVRLHGVHASWSERGEEFDYPWTNLFITCFREAVIALEPDERTLDEYMRAVGRRFSEDMEPFDALKRAYRDLTEQEPTEEPEPTHNLADDWPL